MDINILEQYRHFWHHHNQEIEMCCQNLRQQYQQMCKVQKAAEVDIKQNLQLSHEFLYQVMAMHQKNNFQ